MKKYRILTLDGGGIRGLITAVWLDHLQEKLGTPLWKHFNLIAGTSTGSILACAISMGIQPKEIISLYMDRGKKVFPTLPTRLWGRFVRTFSEGISAPKYDGKGLEEQLKKIFKEKTFGELKIKPTLVISYDTLNRHAKVFKNSKPEYVSLPVWELCKASSSAPTYFPCHVMKLEEGRLPLIDGGVVANNPTACAIAEAVRINQGLKGDKQCNLSDFVVASFGTGEATRPIPAKEAVEWGAVEWALPIIDVLFDGSGDAVNYIATQLLDKDKYFRFQTRLSKAYDDMDNADATNLNALVGLAREYIDSAEGKDMFTRLIEQLV